LLELRFVPLLAFAVLEFSEVHDTANGRLRRGRNFNQIKFGFFCQLVGGSQTYDSYLLPIGANDPDFRRRNFTIDSGFFFLCYATSSCI
jgi:hypothetical protein